MKTIKQALNPSNYQQKLNTPEWEKFSRDTRKARGNACQMCKRTNVELHLHHIAYEEGKAPWESDPTHVVLLCRACHKETHEQLNNFRKYVFGKMNPQAFRVLNGALAVAFDQYDPLVFTHALAEFVATPRMVGAFVDRWGMSAKNGAERPYKPDDQAMRSRAQLLKMQAEDLRARQV